MYLSIDTKQAASGTREFAADYKTHIGFSPCFAETAETLYAFESTVDNAGEDHTSSSAGVGMVFMRRMAASIARTETQSL